MKVDDTPKKGDPSLEAPFPGADVTQAPPKIVPFYLEEEDEDDDDPPSHVLGMLKRKDFELWISQSTDGTLSVKWWRWRDDLGKFFPMEDGELTLSPQELQPLAELLISVGNRLKAGKHR